MEKVWNANLEVNLENIKYNIKKIKDIVGENVGIMPVIKDNGYGTGIYDKMEVFDESNIKIVGVAIVDEGISLREKGYKGEIFVLNQTFEDEIPSIAKYNLTIGVGDEEYLDKIGKYNADFKIHMEIGSGMGRTGIHPYKVSKYIDILKQYSNIQIEGIYTHFSCSDCDEEYTRRQLKSFNIALDTLKDDYKEIYDNLKYIHTSNSAAVVKYPEARFNLVRPGILLYGYYPSEELKSLIQVKPSMKLKSKISFLKEVEVDTSIGYGRTFITNKKTQVATIPLGYADGIRRALSNRGQVVINNKLAPIIGSVCMDCFMVDVTDIENVNILDDVYIWDNDKITVDDVAKLYGTINYEVITTISNRVVRKYDNA